MTKLFILIDIHDDITFEPSGYTESKFKNIRNFLKSCKKKYINNGGLILWEN